MAVQERLYTAEDLWELSHKESHKRFELMRGVIVEMAPPGGVHGETAGEIYAWLRTYIKQHQMGRLTIETGYILSPDPYTILAPDVAFVTRDRAPEPLPEKYVPFAPDLAIEVVSPGDTAAEIQDKIGEYLRAGVHMVWVVYPRSKTVNVYTPTTAQRLSENDTLDGGDVLPGFAIKVGDIFPE